MNIQHTNNTDSLAFYSMYHNELALKFDCVVGKDVLYLFAKFTPALQ